jgi:cytochrome b
MNDPEPPTTLVPVKVWDTPTRLFHWALAVLVGFSWLSNKRNWMDLHFLSGYSVLALLAFRIAWGFLGSETARFARFLKSPRAAIRHLARLFVREPDRQVGHNAAGGWMVLVLLALLAVQVGTGLSANDDIMVEGPLFKYIGKELSDRLSSLHAFNFKLIELAVLAHVLAVTAYGVFKRQNLVRPMITGRKLLPGWVRPPRLASPVLAAIVVTSAAVLAALVSRL